MHASALISVKGLVQGVGYRYFAYRQATQLDLNGYVRNNPDSSVESYVEGPRNNIEEYLEALRRGPQMSRVTSVKVRWQEYQNRYDKFEIVF
jgi:acylphosphatase